MLPCDVGCARWVGLPHARRVARAHGSRIAARIGDSVRAGAGAGSPGTRERPRVMRRACGARRDAGRGAFFVMLIVVILYKAVNARPRAPPTRAFHCISDRSTGAIGAHIWKPATPGAGARARVHTTSSLQQSPVTSREPSLYRVARFPAFSIRSDHGATASCSFPRSDGRGHAKRVATWGPHGASV